MDFFRELVMKKVILLSIIAIAFTFLFTACDFEQMEIDPMSNIGLSKENEKQILYAFFEFANLNWGGWVFWDDEKKEYIPQTKDDIFIEKYYGTYNGCAVVSINGKSNYTPEQEFPFRVETVLSGVSFFDIDIYSAFFPIVVYKEGIFFSLPDAYEQGLLKISDLKDIAYHQNKDIVFPVRIPVNENTVFDEKIIANVSIDDHFADDSIVLIIDGNFTDWRIYAKDFETANVEVIMVDCLTITDMETIDREIFRHIYSITLKNKSKQNVIDVIKKLEKFPFIKYAGPNYYLSPQ